MCFGSALQFIGRNYLIDQRTKFPAVAYRPVNIGAYKSKLTNMLLLFCSRLPRLRKLSTG